MGIGLLVCDTIVGAEGTWMNHLVSLRYVIVGDVAQSY